VYGAEPDPEDAIVLEGIRRAISRVLAAEGRDSHDQIELGQ